MRGGKPRCLPPPGEKSVNPATARAGPAAGSTTKRGGGAARGSPGAERPPRSRVPALPCGPRGAAPSRTVPPPPGWMLPLPSGGGCLLSPQPASLRRPPPRQARAGLGRLGRGPGHGLAPAVVAGLRTSRAGEGRYRRARRRPWEFHASSSRLPPRRAFIAGGGDVRRPPLPAPRGAGRDPRSGFRAPGPSAAPRSPHRPSSPGRQRALPPVRNWPCSCQSCVPEKVERGPYSPATSTRGQLRGC